MAPWLRVLEAYLVQALLRTPAFHRGVEKVVRGVNRIRHGVPPEEMGGTKIDQPDSNSFLRHFTEEVQTQLGRAETKTGETSARDGMSATARGASEQHAEDRSADAIWRSARKYTAEKDVPEQHAEDQSADAVWRTARKNVEDGQKEKQGFLGEYMAALREQVKGGK